MKKPGQININMINQPNNYQQQPQTRFTAKTSSAQSYRAGQQQNFLNMEDLLYSKKSGSNPNLIKKMPSNTSNKFHTKNQSQGASKQMQQQLAQQENAYPSIVKTPKIQQSTQQLGTKGSFSRQFNSPQNMTSQQQNSSKNQNESSSYFKKYFPSTNKASQSNSNNTNNMSQQQKLKYNNYFDEEQQLQQQQMQQQQQQQQNQYSNGQSKNGVHSRQSAKGNNSQGGSNTYLIGSSQNIANGNSQSQNQMSNLYNSKNLQSDRPPSSSEKNWKQNYLKNLKEYQKTTAKKKIQLSNQQQQYPMEQTQNGNSNQNNGQIHISNVYNNGNNNGNSSNGQQNMNLRKSSTDQLEKRESNSKNDNNHPYMNGALSKANLSNKSKKSLLQTSQNQQQQSQQQQSNQENGGNLNQFITKVNRGDNLLGNMPQFNSPRAQNGMLGGKNYKLNQQKQQPQSTKNSSMNTLLKSQQQQQEYQNQQLSAKNSTSSSNNRKIFHFPNHNKANSYSGIGLKAQQQGTKTVNHSTNNNNNEFSPNKNKNPPSRNGVMNNSLKNINQSNRDNVNNGNGVSQSQMLSTKNSQMFQMEKNASKFMYYMTALEKAYKVPQAQDYFSQLQREHFLQTCQGIMYSNLARPANPKDLQEKKVYLKKKKPHQKKTIVFDLDETLIHCNENVNMPHDVKLSIKFPQGEVIEAGINIRPYARQILKDLSEDYEIVIFTASHSCYAKTVIDHLDPQKQWVSHRFFREHCIQTPQGVYIKDLRIFADRPLEDLVLVDNAAYSFSFQIDNGIPIIPYYHHKDDKELKYLTTYLKQLEYYKDVREYLRQTFKLQLFNNQEGPGKVYDNLFK